MNTITYVHVLKDNYVWLMLSKDKSLAIAVDPGEAEPVIAYLQSNKITLSAIILTHHHKDHTAGVNELVAMFQPQVYAYSQLTSPYTTHSLESENSIYLHTHNVKFAILKTPGHTNDAICYFDGTSLFSGDTLFAGGCGRLFEGTTEQMFNSLNQLAQLPDHTNVYCGHEYTVANLKFALDLEPNNPLLIRRLNEVQAIRANNLPSLPSSIGIEKLTNPFLRCNDPVFNKHIAQHLKCGSSPLQIFTALRHYKNNWSL